MMLTAEEVRVRVGDATLLRRVSLGLNAGQITGIIGPNGAGKSTLLASLAGDLVPSSGAVLIDDRDLHSLSHRQRAQHRAVMLQDTDVSFSYLVRDIVEMGRSPYPKDGLDRERVSKALQAADVTHLQDRVITSLSGGERARVAFARVLCQDTPVVLLDEPTAALDIRHQEQLLRKVRDLKECGAAVAVVLHDLNLAAAYCDSIVLMRSGKVFDYGKPDEVMTSEKLSEVYECEIAVTPVPGSDGEVMIRPIR